MSARKFKPSERVDMSSRQGSLRLRPVCHAIALMLAAGVTINTQAATNLANIGAQMNAARNAAGAAGRTNLGVSPQQALQASQPSIQNLAHAAQGIAQQIAAQQAAAAAATTSSNVPNGLAAGGLQVAPGATSNSPLWLNANLPTQSVSANGQTNVNVQQTGADAILTWQTMNVGRQTTLNFDQSGGDQTNGANNWVVLNRIEDPSGKPSQILGSIKAQGAVYVINRNGILFGAGSQVNVHSLVASSLDFLNMNDDLTPTSADVQASNNQFLLQAGGLVGASTNQTTNATEVLGLGNTVSVSSTGQYQPGDVTIEAGASITTHANGNASDGGFVLIAAPNVTNAGEITTTNGQTILAAGIGVALQPNVANPQVLLPELTGQLMLGGTDVTPAGTLINTGIIQADKGYISLLGSNVNQSGVVGVTTGVSYPGGVTISTVDEAMALNPAGGEYGSLLFADPASQPGNRRAGLLSFGPGSLTVDMPEEDGETTTSDQNTTFTPGSIALTAGSVWFQSGSLIEAPGATVTVAALSPRTTPPGDTAVQGRIFLDSGATIDVSGLSNVELPIADTLVTVPLIGANELADSPLLRDGFLNGFKNVVFDSTLSGTNSDGSQWVGSPILNLSGYVSLIPRTIDQLLTNGGSITLSGAQVMTADGSSLNLNGGYVHYLGGVVDTTRLVDSSGAIVPIGQASPYDTYIGVAGEFIESHPRWGVTRTWYDPLLTGGAFEPDFIVGGNAGTLNVFASQALVLDGDMTAQAFGGSRQVQDGAQPNGGTFALGAGSALSQTIAGADNFSGEPGNVILQNNSPQLSMLAPGFSATTPLDTTALNALGSEDPDNILAWQTVPVNTLNAGGFSNVSVTEDQSQGKGVTVAQGTQLTVQPGGSIRLNGPSIDVLGSLIATGGDISLASAGGNIVVGPDATVSVAGQWVNDDTLVDPETTLAGSEYINGGTITLSVAGADVSSTDGNNAQVLTDTTGSIELQQGSVLDVSSGGYLQADGQLLMKDGVPEGMGGSISLLTYVGATYSAPGTPPSTGGRLEMDGTIRSAGFAGGGTLTLQALGFQIGGDPSSAPVAYEYLPANFFEDQGFGNYVLNAMYGVDVAPGAIVRVTQQNLIPDVPALQEATTGADIKTAGLTALGTLDPFHRQATGLAMTGGGYLTWSPAFGGQFIPAAYAGVPGDVTVGLGASIIADVGAAIGLGSATQVTVLGSIVAPGGSILLSADTSDTGFDVAGQAVVGSGFTTHSQSVWLGSDAVLDVSGVALTDPLAAPVRSGNNVFSPDTGKVLPGGSVVLSDNTGYVVAQAGSTIDVSGTSTRFDELQPNGTYVSQPVWSDAGSITIGAANGLYFNASLHGQAGASQAQGGTLTLLPEQVPVTSTFPGGTQLSTPGATALIIQQSGVLVPAADAPGDDFTSGDPAGVLQFSASELDGSGISTLVLGGSPGGKGYRLAPVPIAFAGPVDLSLNDAVIINAAQLVALPAGSTSIPTLASGSSILGAPMVTISAPYVALIGPQFRAGAPATISPTGAVADGALNINASFIDIENQISLSNFGQANFTSSGDIRLSSTNSFSSGTSVVLQSGVLATAGDLTFTAADVYPASGTTFVLDAVGPVDTSTNEITPTTITFLSNGASGVPLSAGGSLLVDATNIVQSGTIRAPSGSLVFGVGDMTDPATVAQFSNLPLVNTQSVTLGNGSITSVSDGGVIIPYGTTVDGTEWQYNSVLGTNAPDLTAPPSKFISVNGSNVSLNAGATIDLSGGGNLHAEEWVPGTGGTRDLLSQYNVSFTSSASGIAVPVNPGGANVYAVVPGYHAPVAAYDPAFAQVTEPSTQANGSASTATTSIGVGAAGLDGLVGQAVYLQGVPGLPAGVYTLLPAKYATLPGAFRVVAESSSGVLAPNASNVLPDGSAMVAGYNVNALTGSRSATPTLFEVQSGPVWQQYSQYTLSDANSFFPALAASAGHVTPQLPMDGGQLVLAATKGLSLGATLDAAPAAGGAPAEVDIAAQDIQVVGEGEAALPGYLQISASQLDALGAGSLLIGGTRTPTIGGITIDAIANSVVVSNDASDPLTGPEVMLITKTDASGADPAAVNGLRIDAGSVISAEGAYPAAKDVPMTISGDGAFLSVSNGADSAVTRQNTTGTGLLTVGAGATLNGGQALTLDSSGNLTFDPSATFSGNTIAVDGSAITFTDQTGAAAANLPGFVVGEAQLAQLANAQNVILRSYGAMNFDGNVDVTFGENVDLSAGTFLSDGGTVTINAPTVAFTNEAGAPVPTGSAGAGTLTVNAGEIDFGTGDKTVSGFASASMNATNGIVGQGTGTFDFGTLPVTLSAPEYLAGVSSDETIKTSGTLNLNAAAGIALARIPLGGALSFVGGTLNDNGATIEAPAGNVSLEATAGDLTVGSGSMINSAGVTLPFFDIVEYAPAGAIKLTADAGTVNVEAGSILDFSGAPGGGSAGSLALSAPDQTVQLGGVIKGNAATGFLGGSFSLNTGGAVDLDNLSGVLASSGVNDEIDVETNAGNLILSTGNTLVARTVSLTANGGAGNASDTANGNVIIDGTINANGVATVSGGVQGGTINLYGKSSVDVEGTLLAEGSDAYLSNGARNSNSTQLGGTINVGTSGTPTVGSYNASYGYENVALANSGKITLGTMAVINVAGGGPVTLASNGLEGGVINLRAPLLDDGTVNVDLEMTNPASQITGARKVGLEAYAVWSTTDSTTGAQHFDGVVDPAGWYGDSVAGAGQPGMVAGTWADQNGNPLPNPTADQLADYLANDFFTPAAGATNPDHQAFYGYQSDGTTTGTLMGFVENGVQGVATQFANTGIANFAVVPGIELDNPDITINNGDISILTNWNLGAGSSATDLAFRFNGQAPIITFRAKNNVEVDASLTDGFFQIANPTASSIPGGTSVTAFNFYEVYYHAYASLYDVFYGLHTQPPANTLTPGDATQQEIAQYFGLYDEYAKYLAGPDDQIVGSVAGPNFPGELNTGVLILYAKGAVGGNGPWATGGTPPPGQPVAPTAPTQAEQLTNPASYQAYLKAYAQFFDNVVSFYQATGLTPVVPELTAPAPVAGPPAPGPTDNSPSPVSASTNSVPLLLASLNGGNSSSFRIVSGANLSSADPLSVQSASALPPPTLADGSEVGSVTVNGHFEFANGGSGAAILQPTMIRTGTGSIDIVSANDFTLSDATAPGVIYTAGVAAADAPAMGSTVSIDQPGNAGGPFGVPSFVITPAVNPMGGGDISIQAQNDIKGIENVVDDLPGSVTGVKNGNYSQFWWQWMQLGNDVDASGKITRTSIDFGAFDQGVMSVGGNVSIKAGGDITDLAVSLPTTWFLTPNSAGVSTPVIVGGGNLTVQAGGSILSGDYFVANGTGSIIAGGSIASDGLAYTVPNINTPAGSVSTLLATQNGVMNVTARAGVDIGGVFDPSYIEGGLLGAYGQHADSQGYSSSSAVNVVSTTGDIVFGSLGADTAFGRLLVDDSTGQNSNAGQVLPATVNLAALSGGIDVLAAGQLYPSATGELSLIATQSIDLSAGVGAGNRTMFGLIDADPSSMPSPTDSIDLNSANGAGSGFLFGLVESIPELQHASVALHASDTQPVRIYSLGGSINDGVADATGIYSDLVSVAVDKPAQIYAGGNIVNLVFSGQNLGEDDVTRIVAGGSIEDVSGTSIRFAGSNIVVPALVQGGPGTFDIEAGGDIGPLSNQANFTGSVTGIDAVGNGNNPFLPHESADVQILFGVGPGIDNQAFISTYVDPASVVAGVPSATPALSSFMEQYDAGQYEKVDTGLAADKAAADAKAGTLTAGQAWSQFQALPSYVQQIFVQQELFSVLTGVGSDFNNASSPFFQQYARGYQAINTLFPASLGYTSNDLSGGVNGANKLVTTGNLDIRSSTIQTQQGGNVSILGPGGQALIGSASAPPEIIDSNGNVVAGPNTMGILTLEQGDVDIFTDKSLLLAQSRIFTEQGGGMTIWSSNGDINAGQGSKSVSDVPPPDYVCDQSHYCTLDVKGEVTGAGIGTLQTIPGAARGSINLIAPRGTVDAGAAGIRVSGDLNIAALHVLNADNIQVQGKSTGIPVVAAVDTGALTAATSAASAATQMAQNLVKTNASGVPQRHWIITVQVEGFGDSNNGDEGAHKKHKPGSVSYDPSSDVSILGYGRTGPTQRAYLTEEEQSKLGGI